MKSEREEVHVTISISAESREPVRAGKGVLWPSSAPEVDLGTQLCGSGQVTSPLCALVVGRQCQLPQWAVG